MAARKIKVNPLSTKSIDEAIAALEKEKKFIHEAAAEIVRTLTEIGTAKAKELIPVDTGEAQTSIIGYVLDEGNIGIINASGEYCVYLEFGTGVRGQGSPHPSAEWTAEASRLTGGKYTGYLSGKHIFTTKDGRIGWLYPGDDGKLHFTEGIESQHFMYDTLLYLRSKVAEIAREALHGGKG